MAVWKRAHSRGGEDEFEAQLDYMRPVICRSRNHDITINHITNSLLEVNLVTRKYGNTKILIKNNKIPNYKQNIDFKLIDILSNKYLVTENYNIGSIDYKTYFEEW